MCDAAWCHQPDSGVDNVDVAGLQPESKVDCSSVDLFEALCLDQGDLIPPAVEPAGNHVREVVSVPRHRLCVLPRDLMDLLAAEVEVLLMDLHEQESHVGVLLRERMHPRLLLRSSFLDGSGPA